MLQVCLAEFKTFLNLRKHLHSKEHRQVGIIVDIDLTRLFSFYFGWHIIPTHSTAWVKNKGLADKAISY